MKRSAGIRLRPEPGDDKSSLRTTADEPEDTAVPYQRRPGCLRFIRVHPCNPWSQLRLRFSVHASYSGRVRHDDRT